MQQCMLFNMACKYFRISKWCNSSSLFRGAHHSSLFYTSNNSGTFCCCVISNTITGAAVWDILFGSLATLIGAFFTYKLRHISKWLAPLPPILANILVVPQVLRIVYGAPDSIWYLTATVGIGEVISCGILGMLLLFALQKNANQIFQS